MKKLPPPGIIESEKDVRTWVRHLGLPAVWVEAAFGGTFGFPDCVLVPADGIPRFCELKVGDLTDERYHFELRPAQRKVLRGMQDAGLLVRLIVGVRGTQSVAILEPVLTDLGWSVRASRL